jgi:hypothetical protein
MMALFKERLFDVLRQQWICFCSSRSGLGKKKGKESRTESRAQQYKDIGNPARLLLSGEWMVEREGVAQTRTPGSANESISLHV